MNCSVCSKTVSAGLYGIKMLDASCGHWVHTVTCMDQKDLDFERCLRCKGSIVQEPVVWEEPLGINGVDYVEFSTGESSIFSSIKQSITRAKTKEPFTWLQERKDIQWMKNEKHYGLQHMIQAGVTIEDFINNDYTWKDLKKYSDFNGKNKERGRKALQALCCNAEHFRDYHVILGEAIKDLEITGKHMVEVYGISFPDSPLGKPMQVYCGKNKQPWQAKDLVKLGFKMYDLHGAGIQYLEQYIALNPTDQDELALGVTKRDLELLPLARPPPAPVQPTPAPAPVQVSPVVVIVNPQPAPPPVVVVKTVQAQKKTHGLRKKN